MALYQLVCVVSLFTVKPPFNGNKFEFYLGEDFLLLKYYLCALRVRTKPKNHFKYSSIEPFFQLKILTTRTWHYIRLYTHIFSVAHSYAHTLK